MIGCDAQGTIVAWNAAAQASYGYGADEALGQRAAMLLQTRFPAPLLEITEELTDLGRWQGRLEHRTKDGRTVAVQSRWAARRDTEGRYTGSYAIEREVTPGRAPDGDAEATGGPARADGQPRRAQPPGQPAAAVAHELNNALAIIINYASFVDEAIERLDGTPSEAERASLRRDLAEVQSAAERAMELSRLMADGAEAEPRPQSGTENR